MQSMQEWLLWSHQGNCGPIAPSGSCNGYIGVETPGISPDAITIGAVDDYNNWAVFPAVAT